jgi:hypothetical protein
VGAEFGGQCVDEFRAARVGDEDDREGAARPSPQRDSSPHSVNPHRGALDLRRLDADGADREQVVGTVGLLFRCSQICGS